MRKKKLLQENPGRSFFYGPGNKQCSILILVGNDGSEGAKKALRAAVELAKCYGAEVHSISVEEALPHYAATVGEVLEAKEEKNGYFKNINDEAKEMAAKEGIILHTRACFPLQGRIREIGAF